MYPLNLTLNVSQGYAVANDEAEHKALSDMGYEPKFVSADSEVETLRAEALSLGIDIDYRWGVKRLTDEIAAKKAE